MAFRSAVRRHAAPVFFVLAFALSWYPWLLGMLGVPKANGINPLGVFAAALVVAAAADGWSGVKALLARVVRVRMGWRWLGAGIGIPLALVAAACAITIALGAALPSAAQLHAWPEAVDRFVFALLFVGLGEEPGWRGFALPALYRRMSPRRAALLLGAVWAVWHLPLMGTEFAWSVVPFFVASVFAGSVFLAWLFNGSRGSVLLCMLVHATVNAAGAGYAFRCFGAADMPTLWGVYSTLWALAALTIAWRAGPQLGLARDAAAPDAGTDAPLRAAALRVPG